jgi:hypothetical protein
MAAEVEADDFDIAKAVFDKLKDVPLERKKRILSWVAESLGVSIPAPTPAYHQHVPTATTSPGTAISAQPGSSTDIKSFVAAKAPKSDRQFAATVAYYYRFEAPAEQRRTTITSDILQEAARLAGRSRFAKPIATLNNAKNSGYLDSGARGEFSINSVGENLVAMTLPGGGDVGRTPAKRSSGKSRQKTRRKG